MRLWSGWYGAAIALPVLLVLLFPGLRHSIRRCDMGGEIIPDSLRLNAVEAGSRSFDKSKPLDTHSVGAKVWALIGVSPGYYDDYEYSPVDPMAPGSGPKAPLLFSTSPLKELLQISHANPDNALALIQTLMHSDAADSRIAWPWENIWSSSYSSRSSTAPPNPKLLWRPSEMKSSDLQTGLALARRGQKLEPNNTFFDWMVARFLFAQNRDRAALQTLQRASRKTGFDLHFRDLMPAGFEKLGNVPLPLAEDKWMLLNDQTDFTVAQWMEHTVNLALRNAMEKQDAGNSAGAVDIEGMLQHLCAIWANKALRDEDKAMASGEIERIWMAPQVMVLKGRRARRQSSLMNQTREERLRKWATAFAANARLYGRSAVATETEKLLSLKLKQEASTNGLSDLAGTGFLRSQGARAVTELAMARTGVQLAWWQGWIALALFIAFTMLGPLLPPRDQPVPPCSPWLVQGSLLGGALLTVGGGLFCCWYQLHFIARQQWRQLDDLRFPLFAFGDYVLLLLGLSILGSVLVGALNCTWWTTRLKRTMPPLPPEPLPYPHHVGAHVEMERLHLWFWASVKFFWFRVLPFLWPLLFLLCGILTVQLQLPLGVHGEAVNINTPLTLEDPYLQISMTFLVVVDGIYFLILPVRWRFFMPRFQRPAVYAGFLAFRRILGWTVPLALWIMLASLVLGCVGRRQFDGQIEAFLRSEGTEVGAPS